MVFADPEVPIKPLWHAVPAYPTISEIRLRLLEAHGRSHLDGHVVAEVADTPASLSA